MITAVLITSLMSLVGACSKDSGSERGGGSGDESATASTTLDGAALYQKNCASCHGADLRGTDRGPSQLSQVYEPGHHTDDSYRAAVIQGAVAHHWTFGDMAPVTGLKDAEIDAIISFIREQQREHGFEPYPPR